MTYDSVSQKVYMFGGWLKYDKQVNELWTWDGAHWEQIISEEPQPNPDAADEESWPVGFMIILTLAALYLGWRLVQGIGWVIDKL